MSYGPFEEYLKVYNEQKRLEKYQQERVLPRPKTTKLSVAIYLVLFFILTVGFGFIVFTMLPLETWLKVLILSIYIICISETYVRVLLIKLVECYQHYASDEKRRSCKCIPSCSEYAILCLKKYELIYSLLKIQKRLFVTCKGFDYIIDNP